MDRDDVKVFAQIAGGLAAAGAVAGAFPPSMVVWTWAILGVTFLVVLVALLFAGADEGIAIALPLAAAPVAAGWGIAALGRRLLTTGEPFGPLEAYYNANPLPLQLFGAAAALVLVAAAATALVPDAARTWTKGAMWTAGTAAFGCVGWMVVTALGHEALHVGADDVIYYTAATITAMLAGIAALVWWGTRALARFAGWRDQTGK